MDIYERIINEPLKGFLDNIVAFLPNIFSALLILVFGLLAGWLTKLLLKKALVLIKTDSFAEKSGITKILVKSGLHDPLSLILARIAGGFVVLAFFIVSLGTLNIEVISRLIEKLFYYLPNVFIALVIIVIGFVLGNFFGRAALITAVNSGIRMAGAIGKFVKYLIILVSISMGIEQLGIGRDTVLISYAIILSGTVLALAIAFGLGGRDAAKEWIEKKLKGSRHEDDIQHL